MGLRTYVAVAFGLPLLAVACGAGLSEAAAPVGVTPRDEWGSHQSAALSEPGDGGDCPHGRLEDPHRGFVRCLEPGEADAGRAFPSPEPEPTDGGAADAPADGPGEAAPEGGDSAPQRAGVRPELEIGRPAFESGEVPKAEKFLSSNASAMVACIADHGGLSGRRGKIKLQFLVRSRGRAEGVEILSAVGVTEEATTCIADRLKNRVVGPPTADPVGVTVTLQLKAP